MAPATKESKYGKIGTTALVNNIAIVAPIDSTIHAPANDMPTAIHFSS